MIIKKKPNGGLLSLGMSTPLSDELLKSGPPLTKVTEHVCSTLELHHSPSGSRPTGSYRISSLVDNFVCGLFQLLISAV